jgi:hypothetical protein
MKDSKSQSTSGILKNILDDENEGEDLFLDDDEPELDNKEAAREKAFMQKLEA